MASASTMCTLCFRATQRAAARSSTTPLRLVHTSHTSHTSSRAYRIAPATAPLLYLDFLAPASRRPPSIPSFRRAYPSPWPTCQAVRTLATAADAQPARAIHNPRTTDEGQPMLVSLSPRAASRLSNISASDQNPNLALRVTVESGGCHGFQYLMSLTDLSTAPPSEEDTVFEGAKGAKVVIDESSLELLNGSTVDYTMELIGSQFKITGIPGATSSCGCGTSFDIKL